MMPRGAEDTDIHIFSARGKLDVRDFKIAHPLSHRQTDIIKRLGNVESLGYISRSIVAIIPYAIANFLSKRARRPKPLPLPRTSHHTPTPMPARAPRPSILSLRKTLPPILNLPPTSTGNNVPKSLHKTRRTWLTNTHRIDQPLVLLSSAHKDKYGRHVLKGLKMRARDVRSFDKAGGVEGALVSQVSTYLPCLVYPSLEVAHQIVFFARSYHNHPQTSPPSEHTSEPPSLNDYTRFDRAPALRRRRRMLGV